MRVYMRLISSSQCCERVPHFYEPDKPGSEQSLRNPSLFAAGVSIQLTQARQRASPPHALKEYNYGLAR